jgi:hypothetical protein
MSLNLAYVVSLSYDVGINIMPKILHGADGFTSPPKEAVLRNSVALKNQSPSAEYETMNLGVHGKHANPYNTEDDGNVYQ